MARDRIRYEQDAREARDDHPKVRPDRNNVRVPVGPTADHGMTGTGMNGFELDPEAMRATLKELGDLRAKLEGFRREAQRLAEPLPDGGGLVAMQMRQAFLDRADLDNGVQAVLEDYILELDSVEDTIRSTLEAYESLDARTATDLQAGR
jgi:hypothetical protein